MKITPYAIALAAVLAGCSSMNMGQPSTAASGGPPTADSSTKTEMNSRMCSVFRSYKDRGEDQVLMESCVRQLGQDGCSKCLGG
jgi:hypothetical protein